MTLSKIFSKYSDWSLIFLRLAVGIVFFVHGIGKLFNIGPAALGIINTTGFFSSLGIPAAGFFAWVVAIVETFGGLFILIGLLTRLSALLLAIDMLVAITLVHLNNGFNISKGGYEFTLVLLLSCIALIFSGAGKILAVDKSDK